MSVNLIIISPPLITSAWNCCRCYVSPERERREELQPPPLFRSIQRAERIFLTTKKKCLCEEQIKCASGGGNRWQKRCRLSPGWRRCSFLAGGQALCDGVWAESITVTGRLVTDEDMNLKPRRAGSPFPAGEPFKEDH